MSNIYVITRFFQKWVNLTITIDLKQICGKDNYFISV